VTTHKRSNRPLCRRITGWINVWSSLDGGKQKYSCSKSREDADRFAASERIACIPIDIEFTEGDGLEDAK
jgi:hypothetical protein